MPPELLNSLNPEEIAKAISDYQKFERKWNIRRLLGYLFIGCSFLVGVGVFIGKSESWVTSVNTRLNNLESFTGYNSQQQRFDTHDKREKYLNSIPKNKNKEEETKN